MVQRSGLIGAAAVNTSCPSMFLEPVMSSITPPFASAACTWASLDMSVLRSTRLKRPQWSDSELDALRDIGNQVDAVASMVNTIAIGIREAVHLVRLCQSRERIGLLGQLPGLRVKRALPPGILARIAGHDDIGGRPGRRKLDREAFDQ